MTHIHKNRWQVFGIPLLSLAASVMLAAAFAIGAYGARAQTEGAAELHPAHIHLGTCTELDPNPTFPLTEVALAASESGAEADAAAAIPVERSVTTVDATIEDLRGGGYAINIHQSVEDIDVYIACGNLSGTIDNGALIVGLGELNASGHSGIAILTENGEQTDVNVYLAQGLSGATETAAENTTTDEETETMANAAAVDIKDFAYVPDPIEISVGGAVTWTNSDTVPHTATGLDREVLQSGTLNAGDSFSQTFAEPGTFDYFCEFHANMKGTVIVQ